MEASEDEPLKAVITLVTTSGERVNLEQDVYDVAAGTSISVNMSVENWDLMRDSSRLNWVLMTNTGGHLRPFNTRPSHVKPLERWHQLPDD